MVEQTLTPCFALEIEKFECIFLINDNHKGFKSLNQDLKLFCLCFFTYFRLIFNEFLKNLSRSRMFFAHVILWFVYCIIIIKFILNVMMFSDFGSCEFYPRSCDLTPGMDGKRGRHHRFRHLVGKLPAAALKINLTYATTSAPR